METVWRSRKCLHLLRKVLLQVRKEGPRQNIQVVVLSIEPGKDTNENLLHDTIDAMATATYLHVLGHQ